MNNFPIQLAFIQKFHSILHYHFIVFHVHDHLFMLCGKVNDVKVNLAAKCNGGKVIVTPIHRINSLL